MSTTTQILFNSPALHALRRDQLLRLCKIHNLKATGRNEELIERLKRHAQALFSEANRPGYAGSDIGEGPHNESNDDDDAPTRYSVPRASEQWELMDAIEEVEESSSQSTFSSLKSTRDDAAGEFGAGGSKSSSVSSSIKALANSLGFSRANSNKRIFNSNPSSLSTASGSQISGQLPEQEKHVLPSYRRSVTPPNPFDFSPPHATLNSPSATSAEQDPDESLDAPVPGHALRPGRPAPFDARLSLGTGADTTTIRLITNSYTRSQPSPPKLVPFATTFDLLPASPAGPSGRRTIPVWPASPMAGGSQQLYPRLALESPNSSSDEDEVDMPGGMSLPVPAAKSRSPGQTLSHVPISNVETKSDSSLSVRTHSPSSAQPFVFGSPLPQHNISNAQFQAAAESVLEEMNKRLGIVGEQKVGLDILTGRFNTGVQIEDMGRTKTTVTEKFDKMHEEEFKKMDSIASYAARRTAAAQGPVDGSHKRKSSALDDGYKTGSGTRRRSPPVPGTRVISTGTRRKMQVAAAVAEDDEEAGDRRLSKRPRVEDTRADGVEDEKKVTIALPSEPPIDGSRPSASGISDVIDSKQTKKKQKERDAVRRKLEMNKARRRSSRGRVSVGGRPPPPGMPSHKTTSSRFGLFSSAKSLVRNVWNKSTGGPSTAKPSADKDIKKTTHLPSASTVQPKKDTTSTANKASAPSAPPSGTVTSMSNKDTRSGSRLTSVGASRLKNPSTTNNVIGPSANASSSHLRSPIPSFAAPSVSSTARSKQGGPASKLPISRGSTLSSMGSNHKRTNSGSSVLSDGTRATSAAKSGPSTSVKRSSTLLAPTASSLARMQSTVRPPAVPAQQSAAGRKMSGPLEHNSRTKHNLAAAKSVAAHSSSSLMKPQSPKPNTIFSKPLIAPDGSSLPIPVSSIHSVLTSQASSSSPNAKVSLKSKGLIAHKPRVSRSRVIAKLGAQRGVVNPAARTTSSRTRSSMGMGARRSFGGVKSNKGGTSADILASAKKRARQSEIARRKSRVAAVKLASDGAGDTSNHFGSMDVETQI